MIKPEMLPEAAVVNAAIERWGVNEPTKWELDTCRIIIAAALNAWPGMDYQQGALVTANYRDPGKIILPLTENPDDKA